MARPTDSRFGIAAASTGLRNLDEPPHSPWLWPVLLVVASTLGSWALACVTPFAALAVIAAYTLAPTRAMLVMAGIWLANQGVGYGILDYPLTFDSLLWGLAIGAAALGATLVAVAIWPMLARCNPLLRLATGLAAAFALYEGSLFLVALALGGLETFSLPLVCSLALQNVAWSTRLAARAEERRVG